MKQIIASLLLLASLAACSSQSHEVAGWYGSAPIDGSWYHFSKSCGATLCPPAPVR